MPSEWKLAFVLPDADFSEPIEIEHIALVPSDDKRVQTICENSPAARSLIEGFIDYQGESIEPSVLLYCADAPGSVETDDALVAFRNAVALSITLYPNNNGLLGSAYTDAFDFYPIGPTDSGKGLVTLTPARHSLGFDIPFVGTVNPAVPRQYLDVMPSLDEFIFYPLCHFWHQSYVLEEGVRFNRVLFRSLQLAYQASAMPFKNQNSLHDYGVVTALWISALEVLAHPENRYVHKKNVLELLGKHHWSEEILNDAR